MGSYLKTIMDTYPKFSASEKIFADLRGIYDLAVATLAVTLVLFLLTVTLVARCTVVVGG